jgi:iron-sulfur cluster assembly accessory protein
VSIGAKAVVDPKADFFIGGSIVDWVESLMSSGFVVKNPHAASTCSCGKSFST